MEIKPLYAIGNKEYMHNVILYDIAFKIKRRRDLRKTINKIFKININKINYFAIFMGDNIIRLNYYESNLCVVIDNYKFAYKPNYGQKNDLVSMIYKHNIPYNQNSLFDIIKNKIILLKYYFTNIQDIYKVILPIVKNLYLQDPNIIFELFFENDMEIYCENHELFKEYY